MPDLPVRCVLAPVLEIRKDHPNCFGGQLKQLGVVRRKLEEHPRMNWMPQLQHPLEQLRMPEKYAVRVVAVDQVLYRVKCFISQGLVVVHFIVALQTG
jgi:hypothetical protein